VLKLVCPLGLWILEAKQWEPIRKDNFAMIVADTHMAIASTKERARLA
jgi:hypothetical protein